MDTINKKGKKMRGHTGGDTIAQRLAAMILKAQHLWAVFMQRQSERLSRKAKILLLFAGGISSIGVSTVIIYTSVTGPGKDPLGLTTIQPLDRFPVKTPQVIDTIRIKRILVFKSYMDSLARDSLGRPEYNQIIKARPGLMDSLRIIEKTYRSQIKN